MREWTDHNLEQRGRLAEPLRYDRASDKYLPCTWEEAFTAIGAELRTFDPKSVVFYASLGASWLSAQPCSSQPLPSAARPGWTSTHAKAGVRPADTSYAALVHAAIAVQAQVVAAFILMTLYTLARSYAGLLTSVRRVTFDNSWCLGCYSVAQGLLTLAIVHGAPRLAL